MSTTVVVVGRGRMGSAFLRALRSCRISHRSVAGRATQPIRRPRSATRVVWILAVTDAAVSSCAEKLLQSKCTTKKDVVLHLAGMLGVEALGIDDRHFHRGAMHPLVAVSNPEEPPSLRGSTASFVGDSVALRAAQAFAKPIGLQVLPISEGARHRYHAAAALMATGAVALAQGATRLWKEALKDLPEEVPNHFANSLLKSVAHNVVVSGASGALASPLLRGDTDAIRKHLETMKVVPSAQELYAAALRQVLSEPALRARLPERVLAEAELLVGAAG